MAVMPLIPDLPHPQETGRPESNESAEVPTNRSEYTGAVMCDQFYTRSRLKIRLYNRIIEEGRAGCVLLQPNGPPTDQDDGAAHSEPEGMNHGQ
jgi:hypothetical protein